MQRFLCPLIAALALPTAVNAETWYLLVKHGEGTKGRSYSWTVPTASEAECNEEKMKVVNKKNWEAWTTVSNQRLSAICIKGK
tara:strand:+ start:293 stop:541 length:249 start_codon:yes stop_codon:yes gene_type:complete